MSSTSGNPSKTAGKLHAAKGEVKAGLGRVVGATTLTREGQSERAAGKDEVSAAKANHHGQTGPGPGTGSQANTTTGFSGSGSGAGQMGYNNTTTGQGSDTTTATGRVGNNMPANDLNGPGMSNTTDAGFNSFTDTSHGAF